MPNGKPNIVVFWGDDIGITNLSCYSDGLMGYRTPNIDRVANEGMRFTDSYGEQSCTAGRSAFITGQSVYRTGLSKVGMPGSDIGMPDQDPTIAELLKPLGYATGQYGKNHLGDQDRHLPTAHGFDEFFGNLYHLNAEEEPEHEDYPKPEDFPDFKANYGPRGVLRCRANPDGTQTIEDTGPLTKKRMETIDDEIVSGAIDFIERKHADDVPFFLWVNTTHMHFRTHTKAESVGQSGRWQSPYHDTMIDHDRHVGQVLDKLDELGIANDTIFIYSTDNGPHMNSWPDGAMTPFRSEKNTNWEGAFRVPEMIRWPGRIPAGVVSNEMISHMDWLPTLVAAAGDPDVKEKLLVGHEACRQVVQGPSGRLRLPALPHRRDGQGPADRVLLLQRRRRPGRDALRQLEARLRRAAGPRHAAGLGEPFVMLRVPLLFNLRTDPFERAQLTSNTYYDWVLDRVYLIIPSQKVVGEFLQTFMAFPPRMKAASFTVDQVMTKMEAAMQGGH